nr:ribonuclease H-like domain-containing protein [Tanacetum cinerariifolium]
MQKYLLKQQFEGFSVSTLEGLHKGYDRFQTFLSQLEIHGAGVSHEDTNQKFLRVFERDVKGITASSSNTQNVAFVSAENTNNTNDVSTAYSVSSPSVSKSQKEGSSSYTNEVIHSFFVNKLSAPQLDYHDLEQINDDDMEEMDLKLQVAMISMKIKKFHKRTGRKMQFDTKDPVGFDKTKLECFNCHKIGHFARDCRAKRNQDNKRRDVGYNGNKTRDNGRRPAYQDDSKALVTINGEDIDWSGHVEEDAQNYAMMAYSSSNSGFDNKASDLEDTPVNDRFADRMHAVPPHMTGNYMPSGPDVEIDYSKFTYGPKQTLANESDSTPSEYTSCESDSSLETSTSMSEPVKNASKVVCEPKVWTDAPIIEEYESDSDNDSVSNVQEDKEKLSFAFIDSVKHVKTSRKNIKETGTTNHSPKIEKQDRNDHTRKGLRYAFTRKACFDDPHRALKDKGIVDSGCSRHMTGNKAHLADYQEFKGGSFAFRGSNKMITGKGKIKTGSYMISGEDKIDISKKMLSFMRLWTSIAKLDFLCSHSGKPVVITEASIRGDILFNDVDEIDCLTNEAIFENLTLMGYEGDLTKLTFQNALFSPQWKFLIHTIIHCLSSKSTSWDQFPTNIASAVICLATNRKFNFSKMIFDGFLLWRLSKKKKLSKRKFVSKHGRKNAKSGPTKDDSDKLDAELEEDMEYIDTEEALNEGRQSTIDIARPDDDTVRPDVSTARQELSTVGPTTTPTTTTIFDDKEMTLADTLIKLKDDKAKDKGKGGLDEPESTKKMTKSDFDAAQIARDKEIARQIGKYNVDERAKLLAEYFERRKKQLAKERVAAIRNKPPTKTQLRRLMTTYLKNIGRSEDDERMIRDMKKKAEEESSDKGVDSIKKRKVRPRMKRMSKWQKTDGIKIYHYDSHGAEGIYYRIFRSDGSSRWIKTFSKLVKRFDRLDLVELYNLVMQRFKTTTPEEDGTETHMLAERRLINLEGMIEERRIFKCWFYHHTTNGHQFTMFNRHQELTSPEANGFCKELASPKQTDLALAIPEQMATGKEISNPFMAGSFPKTTRPT